ncbi:collagen alpha-1(XV) chain [Trichonephila clavipes]|nr:collagen alpha-1(XV) chain [Trichonephila clavipes]
MAVSVYQTITALTFYHGFAVTVIFLVICTVRVLPFLPTSSNGIIAPIQAVKRSFDLINLLPLVQLNVSNVVNPTETVVQLGLKLVPSGESIVNLTVYYTDVDMHLTSQPLTTFTVPDFLGMWTRIAIRVALNNVTLFYNCEEYASVEIRRIPKKLVFDTASTLYIGQAGSLLAGNYEYEFKKGHLRSLLDEVETDQAREEPDEIKHINFDRESKFEERNEQEMLELK